MFALALLTTICADPGPNASRLAVIRPMPDFTLTTQADRPLRTADLRGKVVLVSFVFTTCGGSCPATTHRMSQVVRALATGPSERRPRPPAVDHAGSSS